MDIKKVNSEVLGILNTLGDDYISKIPENVLDYLKQNCNQDNIPSYDSKKTIMDQNISNEALTFLTVLKLTYMCESEEEKQKLIDIIKNNDNPQA